MMQQGHGGGELRHLSREALVRLAHLAEHAERWEDMVRFVKLLAQKAQHDKQELSVEERNLLSVAFKQRVGALRQSWRTLTAIAHNTFDVAPPHAGMNMVKELQGEELSDYIRQLETELETACAEALTLLRETLLQQAGAPESRVFCYKIMGDYYRYLAEFTRNEHRQKASAEALKAYSEAQTIAEELPPTNTLRLGLALNLSVFYHEIVQDYKRAKEIAQVALDGANSEIDQIQASEDYRDASLILQLIKDNLQLWITEEEEQLEHVQMMED
ncbi:14-3-3-like protein [Hondaea fermentalgiana]|uniref:14-3-3-like protein n=1 Tax=Hondaea fermentalgiana TaxID=2315210 RepID=A0A2R5GVT7_9STRA|nr:14-3-3-like protein [Hondaea fermentalgiana]|eukprot:GBG34947.1 14-3-3-like protein [Hondaea fermentalgiana]